MSGRAIDKTGSLWAITSYFNPAGYRNRRANYRTFRERLAVPLVTVELAFGAEFELGDGDADVLVQLRGGDVMWQKERLLNIALTALPDTCEKVAWLDCDIVFGTMDWADRACDALERIELIQLFEQSYDIPRNLAEGFSPNLAEVTRVSLCSAVASGLPAIDCLDHGLSRPFGRYNLGMAWAARRALIERHGFYEHCIIGGADRALAGASFGCFASPVRYNAMNELQISHYMDWARPFHDDVCGKVGVIGGDIFHLWHGTLEHRGYRERFANIQPFGLDPFKDIATGNNEAWRWASAKTDLHAYVGEYFFSRKEDG